MYNTILIPVESSHIAESAATIELAKTYAAGDSKIVLLNVFEEIPKWASTNLPKDLIDNSIQAIQEEMNAVTEAADANIETRIRVGHSYKTILEVAEETDADLIMVASHQPGVQDFFLGSTAAKVVRHARCSVLVIR